MIISVRDDCDNRIENIPDITRFSIPGWLDNANWPIIKYNYTPGGYTSNDINDLVYNYEGWVVLECNDDEEQYHIFYQSDDQDYFYV